MDMKECTKCGEVKTLEEFYKNRTKKLGVDSSCKDCTKKSQNEYYKNNKDKVKKYIEENKEDIKRRRKEYYWKNKERENAYFREWYKENVDYIKEYDRKYKRENKDKVNNCNQRRRSRKAGLLDTFTEEEWGKCLDYFDNKCVYCGSKDKLTRDHYIPVTKGGHYTKQNVVPACLSCNSSKGNKTMQEWKLIRDDITVEQELVVYVYFISLYEEDKANGFS